MTGIPVAPGELVDIGYLNEVARAHYRKTTPKQVVNSIVETDLLNGEITIGANVMSTARMLRVVAFGDWFNNTGGAVALPRLKLKLGATPTTVIDTGAPAAAWASNTARFGWEFEAKIMNLGATNSQWTNFRFLGVGSVASVLTVFTTGEGIYAGNGTNDMTSAIGANSSTIDTTAAMAIQLTTTLATANALEDMTLKYAAVVVE